jgi:hypothetical protein
MPVRVVISLYYKKISQSIVNYVNALIYTLSEVISGQFSGCSVISAYSVIYLINISFRVEVWIPEVILQR